MCIRDSHTIHASLYSSSWHQCTPALYCQTLTNITNDLLYISCCYAHCHRSQAFGPGGNCDQVPMAGLFHRSRVDGRCRRTNNATVASLYPTSRCIGFVRLRGPSAVSDFSGPLSRPGRTRGERRTDHNDVVHSVCNRDCRSADRSAHSAPAPTNGQITAAKHPFSHHHPCRSSASRGDFVV